MCVGVYVCVRVCPCECEAGNIVLCMYVCRCSVCGSLGLAPGRDCEGMNKENEGDNGKIQQKTHGKAHGMRR